MCGYANVGMKKDASLRSIEILPFAQDKIRN